MFQKCLWVQGTELKDELFEMPFSTLQEVAKWHPAYLTEWTLSPEPSSGEAAGQTSTWLSQGRSVVLKKAAQENHLKNFKTIKNASYLRISGLII